MTILNIILLAIFLQLLAIVFRKKEKLFVQLNYINYTILLTGSGISFASFNKNNYNIQFNTALWHDNNDLNIHSAFGVDGLSLLFLFLTSILAFVSYIFLLNSIELPNKRFYTLLLNFLVIVLILIFTTTDLLLFYIFFEATLIPMFFLIGMDGSRERKTRAAYLLLFFTLFGSFFFLMGILYLFVVFGGTNFECLHAVYIPYKHQTFLWIIFFFAFACKIPIFPFHIWLPEAHVEAPTVGSAILAGVLLKLGIYGFIRFNVAMFPLATQQFSSILCALCIAGIIYASVVAMRQTDLKRIVAYSSVAHMNLVVLGLGSGTYSGIVGGIMQSISHGFVSAAMFFLIGMLYNRYHSRSTHFYAGMVHVMPLYTFFFFFFTFSNIALPPTSSFVGEYLILLGVYQNSTILGFFATIGVILCTVYSLWLYNKICFGNLNTAGTIKYSDLTIEEFFVLLPLFYFVCLLGLTPWKFVSMIEASVSGILSFYV